MSALLVTRGDRPEHLRRAALDFAAQTWPDRELVVVCDASRADAVLDALAGHPAVFGTVPDGTPLGAARNRSRALARGDLHLQWDDDDRCHPERIAAVVRAHAEAGVDAICAVDALHWTPGRRALAWLHFGATETGCHPGTLCCRAGLEARYPEDGPFARRGEDTAFLTGLAPGRWRAVPDLWPYLLYTHHGANTWDDAHHQRLVARLGRSPGLLRRAEARIRAAVAPYDLGPLGVCGPAGEAFAIG